MGRFFCLTKSRKRVFSDGGKQKKHAFGESVLLVSGIPEWDHEVIRSGE